MKGVMEVVRKVDVKERRIRMVGKEENKGKREEGKREGRGIEREYGTTDVTEIYKRL